MPKKVRPSLRGIAYPDKSGNVIVLSEGMVIPDEHPAVRAHPEWFVDVFDGVEQMTAAPGETRKR